MHYINMALSLLKKSSLLNSHDKLADYLMIYTLNHMPLLLIP